MKFEIPFLEQIVSAVASNLRLRRFEVFEVLILILLTTVAVVFRIFGERQRWDAFYAVLVVMLISLGLVFYSMVLKQRGR